MLAACPASGSRCAAADEPPSKILMSSCGMACALVLSCPMMLLMVRPATGLLLPAIAPIQRAGDGAQDGQTPQLAPAVTARIALHL